MTQRFPLKDAQCGLRELNKQERTVEPAGERAKNVQSFHEMQRLLQENQ